MCNLYLAYEEHFRDLMIRLIEVEKEGFSNNDLFSEMVLSKANSYDIRATDVMIYSVFSFMNPPNSLGNFLKLPTNKIMFMKFFENKEMIQKKIAEVFEKKICENKAMSKKEKSKLDHFALTNVENKLFMALEIVDYFKKKQGFNVYQRFVDLVDKNDTIGATLHYFLAHLVLDEREELDKFTEYIKAKSELTVQKIKFQIEVYFEFAIGVLKLSKSERYDLYIDEQLVKMTEYIKKEKEEMLAAFVEDEKRYLGMLDDLTVRLNQLEKENIQLKNTSMKKTSPINGKRVLVVGDTGRKESYKQIVEQYGGEFNFIDGIFEKEKMHSVSESADIAILVVPRIKHTVSNILKAHKVPVIFVNSAGIGAFEEVVDNYCAG